MPTSVKKIILPHINLSLNLSLTSGLKNVGCWANITSIVKGRDPFEPEGRPILYESLVALFVPLNRSWPWVGVHPTINLNIGIFVDLTTIGERHWRCIKDIQLNILFSNLKKKKIKFSIFKWWRFNFSCNSFILRISNLLYKMEHLLNFKSIEIFKVWLLRKGHKIWINLPTFLWCYLLASKKKWKIVSNFVTF